jgi:hypothetical protein
MPVIPRTRNNLQQGTATRTARPFTYADPLGNAQANRGMSERRRLTLTSGTPGQFSIGSTGSGTLMTGMPPAPNGWDAPHTPGYTYHDEQGINRSGTVPGIQMMQQPNAFSAEAFAASRPGREAALRFRQMENYHNQKAAARDKLFSRNLSVYDSMGATPNRGLADARSAADQILGGGMAPPGPSKTDALTPSQSRLLMAQRMGVPITPFGGNPEPVTPRGVGEFTDVRGEQRFGVPGSANFSLGRGEKSGAVESATGNGYIQMERTPNGGLALRGLTEEGAPLARKQTEAERLRGEQFRFSRTQAGKKMADADHAHQLEMRRALQGMLLDAHKAHVEALDPAERIAYINSLLNMPAGSTPPPIQSEIVRRAMSSGKLKDSGKLASEAVKNALDSGRKYRSPVPFGAEGLLLSE